MVEHQESVEKKLRHLIDGVPPTARILKRSHHAKPHIAYCPVMRERAWADRGTIEDGKGPGWLRTPQNTIDSSGPKHTVLTGKLRVDIPLSE